MTSRSIAAAGALLACSGLLCFGAAKPAAAAPVPFNLVNDGGFEQPPVSAPFQDYTAGQTFGGWTVDSGSIDLIGSYWKSQEGLQSVDLNGTTPGTISQNVGNLVAGKQYQLSFWMASNVAGGPAVKSLAASVNGHLLGVASFDGTGKTYSNMGWQRFTYNFTAASASTKLAFQSLTTSGCSPATSLSACGPALDNVSIQAVPEATTLTVFAYLLVSGLVLLIRRRNVAKAAI
jgi:choice-of-anchor C domain-containing protein